MLLPKPFLLVGITDELTQENLGGGDNHTGRGLLQPRGEGGLPHGAQPAPGRLSTQDRAGGLPLPRAASA